MFEYSFKQRDILVAVKISNILLLLYRLQHLHYMLQQFKCLKMYFCFEDQISIAFLPFQTCVPN